MIIVEVEALADLHFHLREGKEIMTSLLEYAFQGGADVLGIQPNLLEALIKAGMVIVYKDKAVSLIPSGRVMRFVPFVMITENTTEYDIDECVESGIVDGKVYPFMRTNKSEHGVQRYGKIMPIVKHCGEVGLKCHFHPEHPSMKFENRDAEFVFVSLARMYLEESDATIVWEHGTDARCIPHWKEMAKTGRFFVTLTAHHLATSENEAFGDVRAVCKPPIKTEGDRQGLISLVEEDQSWLMSGTDTAWHSEGAKHTSKGGCACGSFVPFALPLYAHSLGNLLFTPKGIQTFINFTSRNARKLHKLPESSRVVKLKNEPWEIPLTYPVGPEKGLPFWAGHKLNWKIVE